VRKIRTSQILGIALIGAGLVIAGVSAYNLTLAEDMASSQQQAAAEVEPLVVGDSTAGPTNLAVGEIFAKLYVPRFGADYVRNIAEGTSLAKVLNTVGVGHYINTQMPGEVGNFAIAGHRAGNGGPMRKIDSFVDGDLVYVETATNRYTYRYLETKIVAPEEIGVIAPEPALLTKKSGPGKYLTLTSCTPIYVNSDRIIAWFEQVAEQPR
jgi:sortase A